MKLTKIITISGLLSSLLSAQDVRTSWTGGAGNGNFSDPGNWSGFSGAAPFLPGYGTGSPSNAIIQGGSTTTPATISTAFTPANNFTPLIVRNGQILNIQANVSTQADGSASGGSFLAGQTDNTNPALLNIINHTAGDVNINSVSVGNGTGTPSSSVYNFDGGGINASSITVDNSGLLEFGHATTTNGAFTVNSTGVLSLDGNDNTIGSLAGSGVVENNNASAATLSAGSNNNSTTFSGILRDGAAGGTLGLTTVGTGTQVLTGANTYTGNTTVSAGFLALGDGGTNGTLSTSSTLSVNAGATFRVNQSDTVAQGTDFSSAAITGAGNVEQAGAGITSLTAANTYTGTTTVSSGTLQLNGGSIDDSQEIAIASGAVFLLGSGAPTDTYTFTNQVTGQGTVDGGFTASSASASIRPGTGGDAGIGTLTFSDALVIASGATLSLELASAAGTASLLPGQQHPDLSTVDNTVEGAGFNDSIEGGVLDFSAADAGSIVLTLEYTPGEGDYFDLLDFTSATGLSADLLTLPTLTDPDLYWNTSLFASEGIVVIVPEPSSAALLGLGGLALLSRRKRS